MARKSLSLTYYTFGHEVGHILGGYHNREVYEEDPHPWAMAYLMPGTNERTILA